MCQTCVMDLHNNLIEWKRMCMTMGLVGKGCLIGCHDEGGNTITFHRDP